MLYKMVGHSTRKHEVDGEKKRKTVEFSPKMRFFSMFRGRIRSRVEPSAQSHGAREKLMRSTRWCAIYSEKKENRAKMTKKCQISPKNDIFSIFHERIRFKVEPSALDDETR